METLKNPQFIEGFLFPFVYLYVQLKNKRSITMAIGSFEQGSRIIPNEKGTGNKVFLRSMPTFDSENEWPKVTFSFVNEEESEYIHGQLDPFGADTDKIRNGGFARLLHFYGAMMTKENYEKLKQYDESQDIDIGSFVNFANGLVAEDVLETEFTALITYNKKGFLTFPVVGDVLSSKYKPKTLQWNPASKTTLKPKEQESDVEGGSNDM